MVVSQSIFTYTLKRGGSITTLYYMRRDADRVAIFYIILHNSKKKQYKNSLTQKLLTMKVEIIMTAV